MTIIKYSKNASGKDKSIEIVELIVDDSNDGPMNKSNISMKVLNSKNRVSAVNNFIELKVSLRVEIKPAQNMMSAIGTAVRKM